MKVLLTLAIAGQFADLITFMLAVYRSGIGGEANPLMQAVYAGGGMEGAVLFKGGGILLMLGILLFLKDCPRAFKWSATAVYAAGYLAALTNLFGGVFV